MVKHPVGQSCGNCRYFRTTTVSFCTRYPPSLFSPQEEDEPDIGVRDSCYPAVVYGDWCGEWVPESPETIDEGCAILARLVLLGDLTAARALADKLRE